MHAGCQCRRFLASVECRRNRLGVYNSIHRIKRLTNTVIFIGPFQGFAIEKLVQSLKFSGTAGAMVGSQGSNSNALAYQIFQCNGASLLFQTAVK